MSFFVSVSGLGFLVAKKLLFFLEFLAKVLVVMYEIWQFSLPIDCFTSITYHVGQWSRAATEHAHFTHITVLLLDKFEERGHVRPAKMVDGL